MLKRKPYIENHKKVAEARLREMLDLLKSKEISEADIQRDAKMKHYRADIRQANQQLAEIEKVEAAIVSKGEIKAQKRAGSWRFIDADNRLVRAALSSAERYCNPGSDYFPVLNRSFRMSYFSISLLS